MNIKEAMKQFHISKDQIRFFEENGLLESGKSAVETGQYNEKELRRIGTIHSLLKAGFELEGLKKYLQLMDDSDKDGQVRILRKQRFALLDTIHDRQQALDALDYMIHEIQTGKRL